jgi:hypothetical protein
VCSVHSMVWCGALISDDADGDDVENIVTVR